jgi:hypothetical protein
MFFYFSYIVVFTQQDRNSITNNNKIGQRPFLNTKLTIINAPQESPKSKVWAKSNVHFKI